ncbi:N-acetylglutaminylglutamine amidotransferase [Streptosporangium roseum]|uniref:asparagine synthase (glutamine-hydrolyzing) n=1 Tax=Streptosporangium roseum (strain ATCC 12428 / DSM 43021 / JCM 3005 / KCTC 9067 / NCIMB 10171 / NRRL 2505 / NI 9100) TaxID=479432 RepID=D2AQS0_STRRD|nr:N-acetylglutaminylglutamine amidotransferase [Streptosporangium roseum]ACZ86467.1 asparagine synthase (glutamine-hydrolyzing) [Streptosporangium roseum DSM 43021]
MCGLSGEIRFDGRAADVGAVGRMTDAMHDRGPDGSGLWSLGPVALGHRRLKIIDLSDRAAQPMVDSALGLTGVFNGCLYNYRELREELRGEGYRFFSTSDTEVLVKAFHRWGPECVEHFTGMFAFAVFERDTGRLTLGRDRLGIKPMYVSQDASRLRFASSLPALLAGGGVGTDIDRVALHHYMTFHSVVPAERTILTGVRKLPSATVRTVEAGGTVTDHCYWRPPHTRSALPEYAGLTSGEWNEAVLDRLRVAVRRRMVADVPVGVLLSGGLDSSMIVALLAEEGQEGLSTFSIGFHAAGGESGDEFAYSDLVAGHFGTDHHRILVDDTRLLPALERAVGAMSEPMVSHDCVAFHLLSEEVSRHVKVVQSGQGADEVFAGYSWYPPLAGLPREEAAATYAREFFDRPHGALAEVLAPDYLADEDVSGEFVRRHLATPGADTALDAVLRLDTSVMLVDDPVKRVDNMTMAYGLEARTPFLDHELVELAAACPPELKLASGGKGVLKDASRKLLPAEVIDRPKGYFPVPAIRHIHGPFLELVRDALTGQAARSRGLFNRPYVDRLLAAPDEHRTTLGANALWQLGLLELWLQAQGVR